MYPLIETIKVFQRKLQCIEYHNARFNNSRKELFGIKKPINLQSVLKIPDTIDQGIFKCRLVYDSEIHSVEFLAYRKKQIKTVRAVLNDRIQYAHKFADRHELESMLMSSEADEILVIKNGFLTDSSFSNVIFYKKGKWFTPESPLLKGVKRQQLLDSGKILEEQISLTGLSQYSHFQFINAMNEMDETKWREVKDIIL